jgi:signal transduction histidine kinase
MMRPRTLRGRLTLLYGALTFFGVAALAAASWEVLYADVKEDEEHARAHAEPVPPGLDPAERALLYGLAAGVPIAMVLGGAGGWYLAGRALRPLGQIAEVARAVSANDLARRMPSGGGAEVDELAGALNELLARLERSLEEVRRFTADAAHELRSPLAAVMGRLEVALRHPRSEAELRDEMGGALEDLGRVNRLVESLLTLARADAGALAPGREPVELGPLAAEIVERDRPLAEERAVRLTLVIDREARTRGSPQLLARALGNLVDNAILHGRGGGAVIVRVGAADGRARLAVEDDGPGIPEAARARLFERFFRGDAARGPRGGYGLGLSLARRIVEAHGGTLGYAPAPAAPGSVFTIELPGDGRVTAAQE